MCRANVLQQIHTPSHLSARLRRSQRPARQRARPPRAARRGCAASPRPYSARAWKMMQQACVYGMPAPTKSSCGKCSSCDAPGSSTGFAKDDQLLTMPQRSPCPREENRLMCEPQQHRFHQQHSCCGAQAAGGRWGGWRAVCVRARGARGSRAGRWTAWRRGVIWRGSDEGAKAWPRPPACTGQRSRNCLRGSWARPVACPES